MLCHHSTTASSRVATALKGHHPSPASVICPLPHPPSCCMFYFLSGFPCHSHSHHSNPVCHPTLYMHSCVTMHMSLPLTTAAVWRPKRLAELFQWLVMSKVVILYTCTLATQACLLDLRPILQLVMIPAIFGRPYWYTISLDPCSLHPSIYTRGY